MAGIFGIVNVTRDSFSDGGRFLDSDAAIAHARWLRQQGADVLDVGAESTHPDAEDVPVAEELRRLLPVVEALVAGGAAVSIDTHKPDVMRAVVARGVQWLNDVRGFRAPGAMEAAASAPACVRFVVMFSRSGTARAERPAVGADGLFAELRAFFAERTAAFAMAGVEASRLVFDPGMGFFLGRDAAPSLAVLRHLGELRTLGAPILVSVSRKSFLGAVTGDAIGDRGAATLAAELWAVRNGAAWVRTHDVQALRSALLVEDAIRTAGGV